VKPEAEIKIHNGVPAIFINGKPQTGLAFWRGVDHDYKFLQDFAKIGVRIILFTTDTRYWLAPERYEFSYLDNVLRKTIRANPRALIIPRMFLMPPKWWIDTNPAELRLTEDGLPYQGQPDEYLHGEFLPSIASEKWKKDTLNFLDAYVSHLEESPFAEHIIGYHLSSEQSEEWFYWGGPNIDYNPANQNSFRLWLKEKYKNVSALRRSRANENVNFEIAKIPSTQRRRNPESNEFFSPLTQQDVIDFYEYHHCKIVDTIRYFAALVKKRTNRRALVSVFYGYQLQPIPRGQLDSGHYALKKLLESRDIDILCSPTCYSGRELGTGYSYFMSLAGSVKLHKKLWFDENDIRTHINVPGNDGCGKTKTLQETVSMQWRQFGNALCNGAGSWWMDQSGGWYNDPNLLEEIKKIYEAGKRAIKFDLSSVAEIAVVIDEKSQYLRGPGANFQTWQGIIDIGHTGAPVDFILLEDLPQAKPYKLYFFKYCYRINKKILEMLSRIVKTEGRWAIWLDRPGYFNEDERTVSAANMELMTGLRISQDGEVLNADKDLTARTGSPAKNFGRWTGVYLKDHPTAEQLRQICREAGVHIYIDTGDVVYANKSFLCIHVNEGGNKKVRLPRKTDVYDLINSKELARRVKEFTFTAAPCSTSVFFLGSKRDWLESP